MKITFIAPADHFSGGAKVIAIYAEGLTKRGHQVVVLAPRKRAPTFKKRVRSLILKGRWSPPPAHSHFDGRTVDLRILDSDRPVEARDMPPSDVIVSTWYETALWVNKMASVPGARVIFIQGYETLPELPRPGIDETWRLPFQKIVISRWLRRLAADKFGDSHVAHVPNSVDMKQFWAPARGMQDVPTVGFLASPSPFKGLKTVLAAVARLRETLPSLRAVCFGQEPLHGEFALPANSEFHLTPPQAFIRELYGKCDLWLCGSQREGFHLPPLEAMACRCPVVSTRVGGPEDIIEPGVNGYLVDIGDAAGLATSAHQLLVGGEESWQRFSDAALRTATRYTWDDAAVLFENALKMAIDRAARGEIVGGAPSPANVRGPTVR